MTRPADRIWLCAIDLDRWSDVSRLVPRGHHTSARLGRAARIATVTSNALVSVAVHELAAPDIDRDSGLALGGGRVDADASLALDQVYYSVSHNDQAIAVATSLAPIGVDIESAEEHEMPGARERARTRAAWKVHGGPAPAEVEHPALNGETGWREFDGMRLWIDDVDWHEDFAIALASSDERAPQVISTTASTILDRWRETVEGLEQPSSPNAGDVHRTNLG